MTDFFKFIFSAFSVLLFGLIGQADASWVARRQNTLPPPSLPTVVDVGVFIVDFGGIAQNTDDSFRLDAWVIFRWFDHRLNSTQDGEYDMKSAGWIPWLPPWHIVNRRADGWEESNHIYVRNKTVEWFQRIYGLFHAPMDFTAFPFDSQSFVLKIEPDYFSNVMQFRAWEQPTGMAEDKMQTNSVGLSAWEIGTPRKLYLRTHNKHVLSGSSYQGLCHNDDMYGQNGVYAHAVDGFAIIDDPLMESRRWVDEGPITRTFGDIAADNHTEVIVEHLIDDNQMVDDEDGSLKPVCYTKSRIELILKGKRRVLKLAWSYFVPVHLIIFLSWCSMILPLDASPTRVSLALLTMLTYEVKASYAKGLFPDVSYTTWILVHNILSLTTLFCIVVINVILYAISHKMSHRMASSLNRVAQLGIALCFVSISTVIYIQAESVQRDNGWCRIASVCTMGLMFFFVMTWVQYAAWLRYNLFHMLATPRSVCRYLVFRPLAVANDLDENEILFIWRKLSLGRLAIAMNSDSQEESVPSSVLMTGVGLLCPWIEESYLIRLRRWLDRSERCQRGAAVPFSFFKRHYRRILGHNVCNDDNIFHHPELPGSPGALDGAKKDTEFEELPNFSRTTSATLPTILSLSRHVSGMSSNTLPEFSTGDEMLSRPMLESASKSNQYNSNHKTASTYSTSAQHAGAQSYSALASMSKFLGMVPGLSKHDAARCESWLAPPLASSDGGRSFGYFQSASHEGDLKRGKSYSPSRARTPSRRRRASTGGFDGHIILGTMRGSRRAKTPRRPRTPGMTDDRRRESDKDAFRYVEFRGHSATEDLSHGGSKSMPHVDPPDRSYL